MTTTSAKLLKVAAEIAGSEKALAERLCIGEKLLSVYLSGSRSLPDVLLLRAVDIVLEHRAASRRGDFPDIERLQDAAE